MNRYPGHDRMGRAIAAVTLAAGMAAMGHETAAPEEVPAAAPIAVMYDDCYQPTAEDYAGVDAALADDTYENLTPLEIMNRVRGDDSPQAREAELHDRGIHTYDLTVNEEINRLAPYEPKMSFEERENQLEAQKPELFDALQNLAGNNYGMRIGFLDKPIVTIGNAENGPSGQSTAEPVTYNELASQQIMSTYTWLSKLPADYFKAAEVNELVLYRPKPNEEGAYAPGFVLQNNKIYLSIDGADSLPHELGHEMDGISCKDIYQDEAFLLLNKRHDIYGDPVREETPSLEEFQKKYDREVDAVRWSDAEDLTDNKPIAEARCAVDKAHSSEAEQVATATDYHTTVAEDKAEIYETILKDNNIGGLLDRCKPILAAKARLILGRMYHIAPRTTAYLLSRYHDQDYVPPKPADIIDYRNDPDTDPAALSTVRHSMK